MPLFSSKPKVELDEFCRGYYDKYILNPVGTSDDFGTERLKIARDSLVRADASFSRITLQKLKVSATPLGFETLALTWYDKFGDRSAVEQSVFTKGYLAEIGREDIWRDMEPYNQALARAATGGKNPGSASGRVSIGFIVNMRVELFKKYHEAGYDDECVARALNRLMVGDPRKNVRILVYLMFALLNVLGFKPDFTPSDELGSRLNAFILGFCLHARQSLDRVRIRS
jgi:hypothetical protein